jgi:hypothetical protein
VELSLEYSLFSGKGERFESPLLSMAQAEKAVAARRGVGDIDVSAVGDRWTRITRPNIVSEVNRSSGRFPACDAGVNSFSSPVVTLLAWVG